MSRRALVVAALLLAGCATTPEGRLRHFLVTDVYWDAARECEHRFRSLHLKSSAGLPMPVKFELHPEVGGAGD